VALTRTKPVMLRTKKNQPGCAASRLARLALYLPPAKKVGRTKMVHCLVGRKGSP
jgi:hypothetical protein